MTETVRLLLVEDDDVDAEGVERALRRAQVQSPIVRAIGGVEALQRLRGDDGDSPLQRPFMILLDLNMPCMGGLDFLIELRADPILRDSIVFVLTTSDADRGKAAAYNANVAGYMLKSRVGRHFVNLVSWLGAYWESIEFPPALDAKPKPAGDGGASPAKSINLLVVDDDALDAELVRRAAPANFRITEAASAAECRAVYLALKPDCVLLDYRLPDADGLSLLPMLRKADCAVVMMTGLRDEKVADQARRLGANDYIAKNALSRLSLPAIVEDAVADARSLARRPTNLKT